MLTETPRRVSERPRPAGARRRTHGAHRAGRTLGPRRGGSRHVDEDLQLAFHTVAHEIMSDGEAAFRPEGVLHQDFVVRCRMKRLPGERLPLAAARHYLNAARAGIEPGAPEIWTSWLDACAAARALPEDLQSVFLILAAAALRRLPCPSMRRSPGAAATTRPAAPAAASVTSKNATA